MLTRHVIVFVCKKELCHFSKWTLLNLTFNDVDRSCLPIAVISHFGVTDIILFTGPTSQSGFYKFVFATRYDHAGIIKPSARQNNQCVL